MSDEERLARVTLSLIGEPGDPRLTGLVHDLGAGTVLDSLRSHAADGERPGDLATRIAAVEPDRLLEQTARRGIRFVVPGDEEWPESLAALATAPKLHERGGVPLGLWCRGPARLDEVTARAVAVVGSRSATTYGTEVAATIAADLATEKWTVVSGAAVGIDQAAHKGALVAGGATVAVLACGADRAYPAAHKALLDHIAATHLVVSEAAPGCAPTRIRFLARNRLIAALSAGTVVVEAAVRSGALNTASWASGVGRPVMGVPGPVTSAPSAGVHQLIRNRDALLVTRADEVLEAVAPVGQHTLSDLRGPDRPRDQLGPVEQRVLDAVPLHQAAGVHSIARFAGLSPERTAKLLAKLSAAGFTEHHRGRWRLTSPPE